MAGESCISGTCTTVAHYCGDNNLDPGEQCDDGNTQSGDGCASTCQTEIIAGCGNGTLGAGEECDDGNVRDGDGCSRLCKLEFGQCGDGILQIAHGEQCDDGLGNGNDNATCSDTCSIIPSDHCGNGAVEQEYGELCDTGDLNSNTQPSACRANCVFPRCGDNVRDYNEECDDGNLLARDGCSDLCQVEFKAAPLTTSDESNSSGNIYTGPVPSPARTSTGPGLVIFLASGAAAGIGLVRRRLRNVKD